MYLTVCILRRKRYKVRFTINCLQTGDAASFLRDFCECDDAISYRRHGFMKLEQVNDAKTVLFAVNVEILESEDTDDDPLSVTNSSHIPYLLSHAMNSE